MFEYAATQDDEITVKEGDIVEIVTTTTDQDGWWVIKKGSQEGLVPDNFLEKLSTEKRKSINLEYYNFEPCFFFCFFFINYAIMQRANTKYHRLIMCVMCAKL